MRIRWLALPVLSKRRDVYKRQALEDSKGAGRIGLTRFRFAVAKVDIILESAIACGGFFICFFRFSILSLFMAFLYRHFGGEVRILSGITMDKYSSY